MDRRRGAPSRPGSSEEKECWIHASDSLRILSAFYATNPIQETVDRVNRLISAWPTDDTLPAEGLGALKTVQQKLTSGIEDVKMHADKESMAIDSALERIGVLIALRKAPENQPQGVLNIKHLAKTGAFNLGAIEKRNKRPRASSPSGTPAPPPSALPNSRSVSITLPPRTSSVGPSGSFRDMKTKRDAWSKQPLQPGRKVVFRTPKNEDNDEIWIIAIVTRVINSKEGKYEVQDVEPQDKEQIQEMRYIANYKSIVPLPDPTAPSGSASHLSAYPIFPVHSTVLALYPDTSCFYEAEVIEAPTADRASAKYDPMYRVRFDDDDSPSQLVSAYWVVQCPPHFLSTSKTNGAK